MVLKNTLNQLLKYVN